MKHSGAYWFYSYDPRFIGNERKYLTDVMDSNFVSSVGEYVGKFEQLCAQYTGVKYAVAAVNGTAALHMALIVAGVKANEEVITQSVTFIATANAISYTGSYPVFIDVDKDTMGMSPEKLSDFLNKNCEVKADGFTYNKNTGRKIAACLPMHTFGHPVRIDEIVYLATSLISHVSKMLRKASEVHTKTVIQAVLVCWEL